ncbi:Asp-tRNA(Asn)/Glu-tRNA(Gln) amidotransferase subunit GatC [Patescibacteria group bacterium]
MELKDIKKLTELARIDVSEEEQKELLGEMDSILGFIGQIQKADVDIAEREVGDVRNIMRDDVDPHESGKYTEGILREAPKTQKGYFEVKKIL